METRSALAVKSLVVELMNEHVYRGDYDNPRVRPDARGLYQYKDSKIEVSLAPSKRDGWLNCAVTVHIVRRRWPRRRLELVLETGYGVEVSAFRPGLWVDYISELLEGFREVQHERDEHRRKSEEDERQLVDERFSPIDDASIFKK